MATEKPNILFIFTDQQRADTIGLSNPVMRTPVMDRLCREGTTFTNAYTPVPVCVAARCSLVYGQYAHNTGCYDNGFSYPEMTPDRPTFMKSLTDAGYSSHGVGKMHFVPDSQALLGFESRDSSEELRGSVEDDDYLTWLHNKGFDYVHDVYGVRGEMYYIPQPSQLPAWAHGSHWMADRGIDYLKNRDRSRPFLLWTSFIHPHPPFSPPVPWNKLYRAPSMPLPKRPPDMENLWVHINRVQNRYKFRDAGIDDNLLRVMRAYYYATISFIDYNVGRILSVLEEQGELDNTLILWSSDHGEFLGDYDCFGKRSFLKPSGNVPFIVRYPERFAANLQVDSPASLIDIMPTFLGAAGIDTGSLNLDGVDLDELSSNRGEGREMIFGQFNQGQLGNYMSLTERWKYIYSAPDNREYLFDLLLDPEETRNCAETVGYHDKTSEMRSSLISHLKEDGCTEPIDGDSWRVYPPPQFPADPDAGLLLQDPGWAKPFMNIPGYSEE